MQTKLQELTEKIYQEGINKAKEEADQLLSEARKEAKDMVSKAVKDAESLLEKARKEAGETQENALNELRLSGRQAISDLKQQVLSLIEAKTIGEDTRAVFKEPGFVQEIIRTVVTNWSPSKGDQISLQLLLPKKQQKDFEDYFKSKARELLDKGLEVQFNERLKAGFTIGPKDGSYLLSFTDEDFEHFFRSYLRPKLTDILFASQEKQKK